MLPPEDADCIVDTTVTGSTLIANRLEIIDTQTSSTRLYANPRRLRSRQAVAHEDFVLVLRSVIEARTGHGRVQSRVRSTPCCARYLAKPTIASLYRSGDFAVKIGPAAQLADLIPDLKRLGATDVVVARLDPVLEGRHEQMQPGSWTQRTPYRVPRHPAVTDLQLAGNEGAPPPQALAARMGAMAPEQLSRYPDPSALERRLAARHGLHDDQVLITAGGDEGLQRLCRAALAPGKRLVLPEPTFEMIRRFAESTGAEVIAVPFQVSGYPTERVIEACDDSTALIAVVTPNNPTGDVISADDLRRVAEAAPQALVMVDLAYTEFADEDLASLVLPNAIISHLRRRGGQPAWARVRARRCSMDSGATHSRFAVPGVGARAGFGAGVP